jgi:hypothetical protein
MRRLTSLPTAAALAACLSLANPATLHAQPVQPAAGIYIGNGLYTAVTASGGAQCPTPGSSVTLLFAYPGPAKAGATFHQTELPGTFAIFSGTFPTTPAAGVATWSGQIVEHDSSSGATLASFTGSLQFNDPVSFLATFTLTSTYSGGSSCQATIQLTFIKTGHL